MTGIVLGPNRYGKAESRVVRIVRDTARHEIREYLSGNYCRCTGYHAIVDAIETAAAARNARGQGPAHE